ncbi:hypothetical protein ACIOD2_14200 [Amycolatopsis sp. NPDC088138]|uniref:hypothetical protein n=1 Tax=Amycolatopsis sp. NPDC088138 TaxID=3363938 RepID=UPI00382ADDB8
MRGIVIIGLFGTAAAYVMLSLSGTSYLIGLAACLAALLLFKAVKRGVTMGGGGGHHKNALTLASELLGIAGFVLAVITLKN